MNVGINFLGNLSNTCQNITVQANKQKSQDHHSQQKSPVYVLNFMAVRWFDEQTNKLTLASIEWHNYYSMM